jgi:hypothetical protein
LRPRAAPVSLREAQKNFLDESADCYIPPVSQFGLLVAAASTLDTDLSAPANLDDSHQQKTPSSIPNNDWDTDCKTLAKNDILFVCGTNQKVWVAQALQDADANTQDTIEIEWLEIKVKRNAVHFSPFACPLTTSIWWDSIVGNITDHCTKNTFPNQLFCDATEYLKTTEPQTTNKVQESFLEMQQTAATNLNLCQKTKEEVSQLSCE